MPDLRDRFRGCLLAGAVGDALGADVEFMSRAEIVRRYGEAGPAELGTGFGPGAVTDDTQMTLFTAEGLLRALHRGATRGIVSVPGVVLNAYLRWLATQDGGPRPSRQPPDESWLLALDALHARRAPGHTCLTALRDWRTGRASGLVAENTSKGCGGVMRMAPVGLLAGSPGQALETGAELAAITHGHPTGQVAAGAFAVAVWHLVHDGRRAGDLGAALDRARDAASAYPRGAETADALDRARQLAESDAPDADAVQALAAVDPGGGPGWVAEEALAVAALCARRYPTDVERALRMAVAHTGDSDSTGSICGNLLGAALGTDAVPARWLRAVELRDAVALVADDLLAARTVAVPDGWDPNAAHDPDAWYQRYPPG